MTKKAAYELGVQLALQEAGLIKEGKSRFWKHVKDVATKGEGTYGPNVAIERLLKHPQLESVVRRAQEAGRGNLGLHGGDIVSFLRKGTSPMYSGGAKSLRPGIFRSAQSALKKELAPREDILHNVQQWAKAQRAPSEFLG